MNMWKVYDNDDDRQQTKLTCAFSSAELKYIDVKPLSPEQQGHFQPNKASFCEGNSIFYKY